MLIIKALVQLWYKLNNYPLPVCLPVCLPTCLPTYESTILPAYLTIYCLPASHPFLGCKEIYWSESHISNARDITKRSTMEGECRWCQVTSARMCCSNVKVNKIKKTKNKIKLTLSKIPHWPFITHSKTSSAVNSRNKSNAFYYAWSFHFFYSLFSFSIYIWLFTLSLLFISSSVFSFNTRLAFLKDSASL